MLTCALTTYSYMQQFYFTMYFYLNVLLCVCVSILKSFYPVFSSCFIIHCTISSSSWSLPSLWSSSSYVAFVVSNASSGILLKSLVNWLFLPRRTHKPYLIYRISFQLINRDISIMTWPSELLVIPLFWRLRHAVKTLCSFVKCSEGAVSQSNLSDTPTPFRYTVQWQTRNAPLSTSFQSH